MVDFYTEEKITTDNWSTNSKGFKTADWGGALEGAGDLVKMAATATDNYFQGTIKEEAKSATDKLYNDYGSDSAVATQGGIDSTATPKEIQQGANRLKLLQSATVAGTLKGSSYWAQAELISRQLKMRYPGYWEQIDSTMSGILGNKPANALMRELESEREKAASEANAKANKAEQELRNAEHAARQAGLTDVFVSKLNGKPYSTDQINLMVANKQAIESQELSKLREYDLKKKAGEATEQDAVSTMRSELTTKMTTYLNDSKAPIAQTVTDYNERMDQVQAYRNSGQAVPPQLEQQMGAAATAVEQQINGYANEMAIKYGQDLPYSKVKEEIGLITEWGKRFVNGVREGDRSLTGSNISMLNTLKAYDDANFLLHPDNDIIRKDAIIGRNMPGDGYAAIWTNSFNSVNPKTGISLRAERDNAYARAMVNNSLFDGRPLKENVKKLKIQKVVNSAPYSDIVSVTMAAQTEDKVPPTYKSNAIEAVYGQSNLSFLQESVKPEERTPMFMKITAPDHLKKIKADVDKGTISSEDWNKVVDWTVTNAGQLVRDQAADINNINQTRGSYSISYDQDKQIFRGTVNSYTSPAKTMVGRAVTNVSETWLRQDAQAATTKLNNIIRNYKNLIELNGEDPSILVPELLVRAGIDGEMLLGGKSTKKVASDSEAVVGAVETYLGDLINSASNPELQGAKEWEEQLRSKSPAKREQISKDLDDIMKNVPEEERISTGKKILMLLLGMTDSD